jgi:CHAT domain-containing protein
MRLIILAFFFLTTTVAKSNIDVRLSKIEKINTPKESLHALEKLRGNALYKEDKIALFKINAALSECYTDLGLYYQSIHLIKLNFKAIENVQTIDLQQVAELHLKMAQNYEQLFIFDQYLYHIHQYYNIIKKRHPKKPIYKALYFAYLSRYYNIKYEIDKANYYSSNALKIYHQNKKESKLIPVHKIYDAHIFTLRNLTDHLDPYKYQILDTLNYFVQKEVPQNSPKMAKALISRAALDFDIASYYNKMQDQRAKYYTTKAIALYDKAIQIHENGVGDYHPISARIHTLKMLLFLAAGDLKSAKGASDLAIEKFMDTEFSSLGFSRNHYFALTLLKAKHMVLTKNNHQNNINNQKEIIKNLELTENIWNRYIQDQVNHSSDFMSNMYNQNPYSLTHDAYLKIYELSKNNHYLEKMHEYDEKSKYNALLQTSFLSPEEKEEKEILYNKRQAIYLLYDAFILDKKINKKNYQRNYLRLKQLILEYEKFEKNTSFFKNTKIVSLKEIQSKLTSQDAIISFIKNEITDNTLYAKVITQNKVQIVKVYSAFFDYSNKIQEFQNQTFNAINNHDIELFKKYSYQLYKWIFGEIVNVLPKNIKHLEIIPNAELSNFPFEILLSKSVTTQDWRKLPYLIKDFHFSQSLSTSISNFNDKKNTSKADLKLFIPHFNDQILQDLFQSEEETRQMAQKYDARVFSKKDATIANFKAQIKPNGVVSIFSHGQSFSDFDDTQKGIYFTDGFLSLEEIYKLTSNCDLLVLGACETGIGGKDNGEGNINLARAFTSIGVKSMLVAPWEVDEKSTLAITASFFSYLNQGHSKSWALQKAKLDFITSSNPRNANPLYWAGLQLIGSNQSTPLGDNQIQYAWFVIIFPLLGLGYYLKKRRL